MDPKVNIERQREIAAEIIARGNTLASHQDGEQTWTVWDAANELAELVQALDDWRSNGGFDPYDTRDASDVIDALYYSTYQSKMRDLAETLRKACEEAGLAVDRKVWDMSSDDYQWGFSVFTSRNARMANLIEQSIDVRVEIAESREYDGENEYGINFAVDITHWGGRMIGGLTPFNYTDDVWVDARNEEAVSDRWKIMTDADTSGVPEVIQRWLDDNPNEEDRS